MTDKKDLRFQRTKKEIIDGFIRLLTKKEFNQITVKMICEEASISRSGFYLHYTDKYDLVERYQMEFMEKGRAFLNTNTIKNRRAFTEHMLTLLTNEGKLLALLISDNGAIETQKTMRQLLMKNAEKNILPHTTLDSLTPVQKRYFLIFFSNAILGVIQEWVHSGQKESPSELVAILDVFFTFDIEMR